MNKEEIILSVSAVSRAEGDQLILKDISFEQFKFQRLAIAGETGAGKTTLLRIISGWIQPASGIVTFRNERVRGPWETLIPGHPGIAYLSQHYELPPHFRVEELLEYADKLEDGEGNRIVQLCRIDGLVKRKTDQLSGGEKQRIALARLLLGRPQLLVMDEPFSNLDREHRAVMRSVISDVEENMQVTCLAVMHDPVDLLSWPDRIIVLQNGKMIQDGDAREIYYNPVNEYTARLTGDYNVVDARLANALSGTEHSGNKFLIRPEHIDLYVHRNNVPKAMIVEKNFNGALDSVHLLCNGLRLVAFARAGKFEGGQEIFISVKAGRLHLLE